MKCREVTKGKECEELGEVLHIQSDKQEGACLGQVECLAEGGEGEAEGIDEEEEL